MAVETRFIVVRDGAEVKVFMDKKLADEYDKMLDMADNLAVLLAESPLELNEDQCDKLGIFLAQQREQLLIALNAKKAKIIKADKANGVASLTEHSKEKAELKEAS